MSSELIHKSVIFFKKKVCGEESLLSSKSTCLLHADSSKVKLCHLLEGYQCYQD